MSNLENIEAKALNPNIIRPTGVCFVSRFSDADYFSDDEYGTDLIENSEYLCTFGVFGRFYLPNSSLSFISMKFEKFDFFSRQLFALDRPYFQYFLLARTLTEKDSKDNLVPIKRYPGSHEIVNAIVLAYEKNIINGYMKQYCERYNISLPWRHNKKRFFDSDVIYPSQIDDEEAKEAWYKQPENYPE